MKKLLFCFIFLLSMSAGLFSLFAGRGGDAFVGGMAGSMVGSMVGTAITKDSGPSRGEIEAKRAQDQAAQLQREQEQQRYLMLQQQMQQRSGSEMSSTTIVLIVALVILFIIVLAMGIMMFRVKK